MLAISAIPAYSDNYIWAIRHPHHSSVYIVDPGDNTPVEQFLEANSLELAGILITHRHWDHITGVEALTGKYPARVSGPACEAIPQVTHTVKDGDSVTLWGELLTKVLATPGHMPEHISYLVEDAGNFHLFCGDTLFSAGCGRIFSGTPTDLKSSLDKFKALPPRTRVYCAHEYTLANLRFARAVEGDTEAIRLRRREVEAALAAQQPSLPSIIETEMQFNPFLRCHEPGVIAAAEQRAHRSLKSELDVFTVLREWKNTF